MPPKTAKKGPTLRLSFPPKKLDVNAEPTQSEPEPTDSEDSLDNVNATNAVQKKTQKRDKNAQVPPEDAAQKPTAARKTPSKGLKKKKRRHDVKNFQPYIHKVLKQNEPEVTISKHAIQIRNDLINDLAIRLAETASDLSKKDKRETLLERDIEASTRLVFGGQLATHATRNAANAIVRTSNANLKKDS